MAFHHATGFVVHGGNFTNADNAYLIFPQCHAHHELNPMKALLSHSAIEATDESPSFHYPLEPVHAPRQAVIDIFMEWVADHGGLPVFWLSGAAGGGKTWIQQRVAQLLRQDGRLAASFFFSAESTNANNGRKLITTIAYQLASSIPGLKRYVCKAIDDDPGIFEKSLEVQLRTLILNPVAQLRSEGRRGLFQRIFELPCQRRQRRAGKLLLQRKNLILIEALDQCRHAHEQSHILKLIDTAIKEERFPFRFVISSRPERVIRNTLGGEELKSHTHHVCLDDFQNDNDLASFFYHAFAEIRGKHLSLPQSWPRVRDVHALVHEASGQFEYAVKAIKLIDDPYPGHSPCDMLRLVLDSTSPEPFMGLDLLFNTIFSAAQVADIPLLRRILHIVMCTQATWLNASLLDSFLEFPSGTTDKVLCDLHSIINIPSPDNIDPSRTIRFHHRSLEAYLQSHERSGDLFQPRRDTQRDLVERSAHHLGQYHQDNTLVDEHIVRFSSSFLQQYLHRPANAGSIPALELVDDHEAQSRLPSDATRL
ncbi:hypothetical protein CC1G_02261 [Coprinopsis cinerea okayama7|uniref:Nephrocystin 3-like N-terminal domain-containing protein n=1 Tax=Coprinopsis cinerea (strain Okayama-7 / 130 / ATCC MYA-4618 / FGSC 9003) TaxID=240176 RepID=A8N7K4_COPC7|nr:hypothetical protein CC1G_02261 [Coprinopsis cinerea okayama7\|eukprot:XP_001830810.1 hypothetical protein CC1G_02261 [Coprinopsis cinerea okayama7\